MGHYVGKIATIILIWWIPVTILFCGILILKKYRSNKWIKCNKTLPIDKQEVDIYIKSGRRVINVIFFYNDKYFYDFNTNTYYSLKNVTHWYPALLPPQEDNL